MSKSSWLRETAKSALATTFSQTGALALLTYARRKLAGPRVHVLAFHRIVDTLDALPAGVSPSLCTTTATFERICRLAKEHFQVLPLVEAAEVVAGRRRERREVLSITFDDGYRDVYLRAWPILRKLDLPATAFVPSGYIGRRELLDHDRLYALLAEVRRRGMWLGAVPIEASLRPYTQQAAATLERGAIDALEALIVTVPAHALSRISDALEDHLGKRPTLDDGAYVMSADELRAIADGGIELGAHTERHVVLVHEAPSAVRRELERPRDELESIAGRPCRSFAYCNGLWHVGLLAELRAAGYRVAVTTFDRPNRVGQEPLLLGRKSLWEGHARGISGQFSEARVMAHLHHLYGDLSLARPVDGQVALNGGGEAWPVTA